MTRKQMKAQDKAFRAHYRRLRKRLSKRYVAKVEASDPVRRRAK